MPGELRLDVYNDLPEPLRENAVALMEKIVDLQQTWILSGEEDAYREWRDALAEMEVLLAERHGHL